MTLYKAKNMCSTADLYRRIDGLLLWNIFSLISPPPKKKTDGQSQVICFYKGEIFLKVLFVQVIYSRISKNTKSVRQDLIWNSCWEHSLCVWSVVSWYAVPLMNLYSCGAANLCSLLKFNHSHRKVKCCSNKMLQKSCI